MADFVEANLVHETSTTTGTGTLTLAGAVNAAQTFAAIGNGKRCHYSIRHRTANEWETGIGTYTASGTLLARSVVLDSSNSGSAVNFSAGTKDVVATRPAGMEGMDDHYTITDGASVDLDPALGLVQIWVLGGNRTATANNFTNGQKMVLYIDDGAGNTLTLPSGTWKTSDGNPVPIKPSGYTVILMHKVNGAFYYYKGGADT